MKDEIKITMRGVEVSDGRAYIFDVTARENPQDDLAWGWGDTIAWQFDVTAHATNFDSPDLNFRALYGKSFMLKNPLTTEELVEDLRKEIILFFEGSAERWGISLCAYHYHMAAW